MQLQTLFAEVLPNNRLPAQQVTSVTCDSRQVQKGSVFVCIRGTLGDGHNYVAQALQKGAVFVVAQQDCKIPNQLLVEDTRRVYSQLCAAFFGYPARKMQLLALTGTNGKTTSAWMLHHALGHLGIKAGLIGTICNRIGASLTLPARYTTPDAWELQQLLAMMFKQGCTHVVMEASSQAIEQQRLYGCQFSCAAFLNLTPEHLDIHGDVEHYFQSKAMLFEQCDRALLRIDDPYARRLLKDLQRKRMPLLPFLLLSAVGTLVWDAVLIALGAAAGSSWQLAAKQFDYQSAVLLMVLFTLVVSILPFYLLKRKRRQRRGE